MAYKRKAIDNLQKVLKTNVNYNVKRNIVKKDILKNFNNALIFNTSITLFDCKNKELIINTINKTYIEIINILLNPVRIIKKIFKYYDLIEIYKSNLIMEYNEFLDAIKNLESMFDIYEEYDILKHNLNVDLNDIKKCVEYYFNECVNYEDINDEYQKIIDIDNIIDI
jgi:tetratricopeptide (TPR) repeat protein